MVVTDAEHHELGVDAPRGLRVAAAFTELGAAI
jgi:hypothetical protein